MKGSNPKPQDPPAKSIEAAERSPTVQSANWKEHMLLQKKLHVLNRSERNLVHRIAIDQKVVFRRFQMKLHRSKLAFAELKGEKTEVMGLRALHLHGLNTNCGQSEGDYAFLSKLQYRPCMSDGPRSSTPLSVARIKSAEKRKNDDAPKAVPAIRSMSAAGRYVGLSRERAMSGRNTRLELASKLPVRPNTAAGTQVDKEFNVMPDIQGESTEDKLISFIANFQRQELTSSDVLPKFPTGRQSQVSFAKNLPTTGTSRSRHDSRTTEADDTSSRRPRARRGSMFEEVKKLNLQEHLLNEARAVVNEPKVKDFCESMEVYGTSCREFDYYAEKMQSEVEQTLKPDSVSIPGTPDLENQKFIGNTKVKSLTMPRIKFTFDDDGFGGVGANPDEEETQMDEWSDYSSDED